MKILITLLTLMQLTSCVSIKNISNQPEFSKYIGSKTLKGKAFLCLTDKSILDKNLPEYEMYTNHGFDKCPLGVHKASLSDGTEIEILAARIHKLYSIMSADNYYFTGTIIFEGQTLDFYFDYGPKPPANITQAELRQWPLNMPPW